MLGDIRDLLTGRARKTPAPGRGPRRRIVLSPPFPTLYAVGDVHGCLDLLLEAEDKILADLTPGPAGKLVIYLGDYIDRGARSAQVLAHLSRLSTAGLERICLCGNHEQALLDFLDDPANARDWLKFGGEPTLRSYGIDVKGLMRTGGPAAVAEAMRQEIPPAHLGFIEGLPVTVVAGGLVFVHAGLQPGVPLARQSDEDMMWIREPFLSTGPGPGLMVVHGHTITREPSFVSGRLGIDTGAYISGRLTVLRIHQGRSGFLR
jgi:serine/threonine protein phosphatase 1